LIPAGHGGASNAQHQSSHGLGFFADEDVDTNLDSLVAQGYGSDIAANMLEATAGNLDFATQLLLEMGADSQQIKPHRSTVIATSTNVTHLPCVFEFGGDLHGFSLKFAKANKSQERSHRLVLYTFEVSNARCTYKNFEENRQDIDMEIRNISARDVGSENTRYKHMIGLLENETASFIHFRLISFGESQPPADCPVGISTRLTVKVSPVRNASIFFLDERNCCL
jgi:hypothetical protein